MKTIDLLRVAVEAEAEAKAKAREAGVEQPAKALQRLPEGFAASGDNMMVSVDEVRVLGGDEEPT